MPTNSIISILGLCVLLLLHIMYMATAQETPQTFDLKANIVGSGKLKQPLEFTTNYKVGMPIYRPSRMGQTSAHNNAKPSSSST